MELELKRLIEPILAEARLELDSLEVKPIGKRRIVRVVVDGDGPQGRGPLLDDISAASSLISAALDSTDTLGNGPYTLEVTSRGVGAPLTEVKHFRRNYGRLVRIKLSDESIMGRIVGVTDAAAILDIDGTTRDVALDQVRKATVQVELNPPKEFALPGDEEI